MYHTLIQYYFEAFVLLVMILSIYGIVKGIRDLKRDAKQNLKSTHDYNAAESKKMGKKL